MRYYLQYRLSSAYGDWGGNQLGFNVSMGYHNNGRIAQKLVYADVLNHLGNTNTVSYNNTYYYNSSQPNVVTSIGGSGYQFFDWDAAGNMVYHQDENSCERFLCWDEENRLAAFSDCNGMGIYQYDAGGERTYKRTSRLVTQNIQGHWATYSVLNNPTLYVSPYLVATPKGYTKHYYAESERVASRTGAGMDSVNLFLSNLAAYRESSVSLNSPVWQESWTTEEDFLAKYDTIEWQLDHVVYECLWTYPNVVFDSLNILYSYANLSPYQHENEPDCYWYHPDHLGSSSWITYSDGSAVQHLHYLPWGEGFVDQRVSNWNAMYTFSAKEKDTETGYSYFGSRYYNSDLSIWLSVDPMAAKYPSLSPYVYCADNPVKLVDPDGEDVWIVAYGANYTNIDNRGQHGDVGNGFKKNAEAYANIIRNSPDFDPDKDEVVLVETKSMEQLAEALNKEYDKGKIAEFTLFSHGTRHGPCLGGQTADEVGEEKASAQRYDYNLRELNSYTMSQINPNNFTDNATVQFYGCNIGGNSKDGMSSSFGQQFADYLGGNRIVKAFVGSSLFTGTLDKPTYPGRMIRAVDKKNQETKFSIYTPR